MRPPNPNGSDMLFITGLLEEYEEALSQRSIAMGRGPTKGSSTLEYLLKSAVMDGLNYAKQSVETWRWLAEKERERTQ